MSAQAQTDRSAIIRACCAYVCLFSASGLNQPYFPLWLKDRGISEWQISLILSTPLVLRLIATPSIGAYADRTGRRIRVIRILSVCVLATGLLLGRVETFWPILALFSLMLVMSQAINPIVDASVLNLVRQGRAKNYGRMRLWGSVGYASAAFVGGQVLAMGGSSAVYTAFTIALLLGSLSLFALPEAPPSPPPAKGVETRLTRQPILLAVFVISALVLTSQTAFNVFGTIYLRDLGYSDRAIGVLWALATGAEVMMFWAGPKVATVLGPFGLLMLAAVAAVIRWGAMSAGPSLPVLILLQSMHAATYSGIFLGMMKYVELHVHDRRGATAQSAFVTLWGLMTAGATLAVGPLYHLAGSGIFLIATTLPLAAIAILLVIRAPMNASLEAKMQNPTRKPDDAT